MICAAFVERWVWLAAPVTALFLLWLLSRALRLRRQSEFASQLLELLHLAVRREQSLVPVLQRASSDSRTLEQGWLERIANEHSQGASLHDALRRGAGGCFPSHTLAAIAAAEGSSQLAPVLADLAARRNRARGLRYQALLATSYPALLGVLFVGLGTCWSFAAWGAPSDVRHIQLSTFAYTAALATCGLWLLLALGWSNGAWNRVLSALARRLPWLGRRLRLLPAARSLRACRSLVASGAPLAVALRQAGYAAADSRLRLDLGAAADLAEEGAPPDAIWQRTGLPAFAIARLQCSRSSSAQLATRLDELAEICERRCSEFLLRTVSILQPAALLGFGILITLQFANVFVWLDYCRTVATEQMPW
ncbi:MAG: type II secretion system F family protein [Planctomycetota bacterium]